MEHLDNDTLDIQYFFALPSTMDSDDVVQIIQSDTTSYNLQELDEEDYAEWKRVKVNNARVRQMKKIREKVGVKRVEKRVEANTQVELNRKWISWHMLVTFEVLG